MRLSEKYLKFIEISSLFLDANNVQLSEIFCSLSELLSQDINSDNITIYLATERNLTIIFSQIKDDTLLQDITLNREIMDILRLNNSEAIEVNNLINTACKKLFDIPALYRKSVLIPLFDESQLLGLFRIDFTDEEHPLQNESHRLLPLFTNLITKVIKKHYSNSTYLKKIHKTSEIAESFLREIIHNSNDGIIIVNTDGNILYCNDAISKITGLNPQQILQKNYIDFRFNFEPIQRKTELNLQLLIQSVNQALISGQSDILNKLIEYNIITKTGETKIINEYNYIVNTSEGNLLTSIIRDITELKYTEQALIESESRYKLIADNSKDIIIQHTREGLINYISPSCFNLTGYLQEELLYKNVFEKLLNNQIEKTRQAHSKIVNRGDSATYICKVSTKYPEKYLWCEITSSSVNRPEDETTNEIITVAHDITERINTLDDLDRSLSLLSSAIESTTDGIVITDQNGKILIHNKIFEQLWDISGDYISTHTEKELYLKITSLIAENKAFKKQILQLYNSSSLELYDIVQQKKGAILEIFSKPMKIGQDKTGRIWSSRDLTKRANAEIALRETYSRLKSLISAIPDMLYFKDINNKYIFVNRAFANWLETKEDKIIGKSDEQLKNYRLIEKIVKDDEIIIKSNVIKKELITIENKNKTLQYFEVIKNPIINENQKIEGLLCLIHNVTTQIISSETLRESEERFRNIFETSSEGIWMINSNDNIILANHSLAYMLGYNNPNDLINKEVTDFIDNAWIDRYYEKIHYLKQNQNHRSDFKFIKAEGQELWVFDSSSPIFDNAGSFTGHLSMLTDVTERYKTIELLFKQKLLFESISLAVNKLITTSGHKQAILDSMDIFSRMLGAGKITIYKKIIEDNVEDYEIFLDWESNIPNSPIEFQEYYKTIISNKYLVEELEKGKLLVLNSKDSIFNNINFDALLFYTPIIIKDSFWGFTEYISNMIDEQILEQQKSLLLTYNSSIISTIEQMLLYENLNEAIESSELANKAKSQFLANISHEIRTPMTAIIGFAELSISQTSEPQTKKHLQTILKSSNHLLALFNDILDLSKIEADRFELDYKPLNLKRIILEVEQIFSQKIYEKNLVFIIDFPIDFPEKIFLDEVRLRQILFNLVGNSIKFTNSGFVKILVECIAFRNNSFDFQISVQDTGIGIPKEMQKSIFESFNASSAQNKLNIGGSGLGLAITKRLVEKMNGSIRIESDELSGSKFDIIFNKIQYLQGTETKEKIIQNKFEIDTDKAKIVIIGNTADYVIDFLNNFELMIVNDITPENIIASVKDVKPHIIIQDIEYLSCDDLDTIKTLSKEFKDCVRIIIVPSGLKNDLSFKDFGYNALIIEKPFDIEDLFQKIIQSQKTMQINQIPSINNNFFEEFQSIDPQKLQHFTKKVIDIILPRIKELRTTLIIDDILQLANEIKDLSSKYQIHFLRQISTDLAENAETYNVSEIRKYLNELLESITSIRNFSLDNSLNNNSSKENEY